MSTPWARGVAVVTGAGSGLGQATAKALFVAGLNGLALIDINENGLKDTVAQLQQMSADASKSCRTETYICDVTSSGTIENTYSSINETFGRIDYSIHCAGLIKMGPSVSLPVADFDLHNSVNYRGVWLCQRAATAIMLKQSLNSEAYPDAGIPTPRAQRGAIVNIASNLAVTNMMYSTAYCASKAAVLALTRGDALDHALNGIRINAVLPGIMDTPMTRPDPETRKALEEGPVQRTPYKRFGIPDEVADVIVFLCGTGASFVTGAGWVVDGGFVLH